MALINFMLESLMKFEWNPLNINSSYKGSVATTIPLTINSSFLIRNL